MFKSLHTERVKSEVTPARCAESELGRQSIGETVKQVHLLGFLELELRSRISLLFTAERCG